ncbi:MAG: hypothetical protein NZ602_11100 [Thermoguttaceae bacterium]|nr:hypothetical protein [Thermoguttaceae bacterium]MDW8036724.1 hypothetical protein [Thermoguttaceae bacterium]
MVANQQSHGTHNPPPEALALKLSAPLLPNSGATSTSGPETILLPLSSFLGYDQWDLEYRFHQIGRRLRKPLSFTPPAEGDGWTRVDAAHQEFFETHWPLPKSTPPVRQISPPKPPAQMFFYGGIIFLTCGLVLLLWAYLGGRPELQLWGWPCVVLGQAGLLVRMYSQSSAKTTLPTSSDSDCLGQKEQTQLHPPLSPLLSKNS